MITRRLLKAGFDLGARFRRQSGGQALVEFALVVPLFLVLAVGLVEFGRAWSIYQAVAGAAREGARLAVLANPTVTTDTVRNRIRSSLGTAALIPDSAKITLTGIGGAPGTSTQVSVSYPYDFSVLRTLSNGHAGSRLNLSTTVVMRHE